MKKKPLKLEDLEVESFVTDIKSSAGKTVNALGGSWTGDCGSFIYVTCPDPNCDFPSIPVDECLPSSQAGCFTQPTESCTVRCT